MTSLNLNGVAKINGQYMTSPFNANAIRANQGKTQEVSALNCTRGTFNTLVVTNGSMKTSPDVSTMDNSIATTSFVHAVVDAIVPPAPVVPTARITYDELTDTSTLGNLQTTGYSQIGGNLVVLGTVTLPNGAITKGMVNGLIGSLNAKADDANAVHLTGLETISDVKTFTVSPIAPTPAVNSNNTQVATTEYVKRAVDDLIAGAPIALNTLNEIATQLALDQSVATAIATNMTDLTSNQTVNGTKTVPSLLSTTQLQGNNSTSVATTAYVDTGLSTKQAVGAYVTYTAPSQSQTVSAINEQVNAVAFASGTLALSYATCKGINYIYTPTANFTLALSNIPTTSTNAVYSVTLMMPSKFFATSVSVNGTTIVPIANGGFSSTNINASATYVTQQISVCYLNSATPIVLSSVSGMY